MDGVSIYRADTAVFDDPLSQGSALYSALFDILPFCFMTEIAWLAFAFWHPRPEFVGNLALPFKCADVSASYQAGWIS